MVSRAGTGQIDNGTGRKACEPARRAQVGRNGSDVQRRSILDFAHHATRIAYRQYAFWNVARDHAAGTDHGPSADANACEDQCTAADPHVVTYLHRLAAFLPSAQGCVERMHGSEDLNARPEQSEITDANGANIQNDAVEIEEHPMAQRDEVGMS